MTFFSLIRQVCVCNNTTQSPPQERRFIRFSPAKTGKTKPLPISTVYRPTRRSPAGAIPTRRGKTGLRRLVAGLTASGIDPQQALAQVNRLVDQQAFMLAANDVFYVSALLFLLLIPLVWLTQPPKAAARSADAAAGAH